VTFRTSTRVVVAIAAVAGLAAVLGALAAPGRADGVTRERLQARGWACVVSPAAPDTVACFDPGVGRPIPDNPDPRPSYNFLAFGLTSGEFLGTGHFIRADLYAGQPCGGQPYVFRARIGYYECVHF
jgi:hypothetical protein